MQAGVYFKALDNGRVSIAVYQKLYRDYPISTEFASLSVVENGWTETRGFPDCAMAHVQPATDTQEEELAITLSLALIQPRESGTDVFDLLKSLAVHD